MAGAIKCKHCQTMLAAWAPPPGGQAVAAPAVSRARDRSAKRRADGVQELVLGAFLLVVGSLVLLLGSRSFFLFWLGGILPLAVGGLCLIIGAIHVTTPSQDV